ncbi:hypothetical protein PILCRDRAFT_435705 [Piloderma croceum F 1598]|uniref:Uncharacterized protein n=1 Tax=Piloderma croceum (strain F 1598) TaxID=765440 RepID=A0A0C3BAA2_PILCF|nr:hypothetical protein PILCRDRAFT_435705 [Piloderma croceum F 1598]
MDTESYQSAIAEALVCTVIYTLSPAFFITALVTAVPWFLLASIISTIVLSLLASHLSKDPNITIFQLMYWCISWAWLGWKILPPLPIFLANSTTFFIITLVLALAFTETLFFSIVSGTGGTLGTYGTVHVNFFGKMRELWDCLFSIPDILARVLGARRRVVANAPAERIGEQSSTAIVPSPARPPPPYSNT